MLHFGIVSASDPDTCRVRVTFEDLDALVSDFLPVMQKGTRIDKAYWLPDIGEHVACLMDQNAEAGIVLGCLYNSEDKPDTATAGVGVRALQLIRNGAAVFLATVRRASDGAASVWAKASIAIETEDGNLSATAGGKLRLRSAGKASFRSNGIELYDLLRDIGQFLKTHNHVTTAPGAPTAVLSPPDVVKALALTVKIDTFLENS